MSKHSERAAVALAQLSERDPGLSLLALWCLHRDADGSTRTHDQTIYYGTEFAELPQHEQLGLAAHHVLHVALRHSARAGKMAARLDDQFDRTLYALVADAIVNETLILAEHAIPRPAVTLSGLLAAAAIPFQTPTAALAEWDTDQLYFALARDAAQAGKARDYGKAQGFESDLDEEDRHGAEEDAQWRGLMHRALELGRQAGTGIGHGIGTFADLDIARVPWELHLRRLMHNALQEVPRRSMRRPAGRWVAMEAAATDPSPVFEPGLLRDALRPSIAIALDTSSSIDDQTLSMFASETVGIARRTCAACTVMAFDTEVYAEEPLDVTLWRDQITRMRPRRDGGTSFVPVMERLRALSPSIAVVLTDLVGPVGEDPKCRLVWAVPGPLAQDAPPFGTVISLEA